MQENVSTVMEMSVSVSNLRKEFVESLDVETRQNLDLHFSIEQENDLVLRTLKILRDSKARIRGDQGATSDSKARRKERFFADADVDSGAGSQRRSLAGKDDEH